MGYKLIASDLDGTLLNQNCEISRENCEAIKTMYKMGIYFVPASGRSYGEMPQLLKDNPYVRYFIGSDGGTIYDKETDTAHNLGLPRELSHFVLDKIFEYPVNMMVHTKNNSYVDLSFHHADHYREHNYSDYWIRYVFETNLAVPDFRTFAYSSDVEMLCAFFKNESDLLACKSLFSSHPDLLVAQSHPYNLEVFWKKAGKGNAVLKLAEILSIDPMETIAVGDSTNDLTMIEAAGLGLAMENAMDELMSAADQVICSNEEHVAKFILENFVR